MTRLTWQDVQAPNLTPAIEGFKNVTTMLDNAVKSASGIGDIDAKIKQLAYQGAITKQVNDANTSRADRIITQRLGQYPDQASLDAAIKDRSIFGEDAQYASPELLKYIIEGRGRMADLQSKLFTNTSNEAASIAAQLAAKDNPNINQNIPFTGMSQPAIESIINQQDSSYNQDQIVQANLAKQRQLDVMGKVLTGSATSGTGTDLLVNGLNTGKINQSDIPTIVSSLSTQGRQVFPSLDSVGTATKTGTGTQGNVNSSLSSAISTDAGTNTGVLTDHPNKVIQDSNVYVKKITGGLDIPSDLSTADKVALILPRLIQTESSGIINATGPVSSRGTKALGKMQLEPRTARMLEKQLGMQPFATDPKNDPTGENNVKAGSYYLGSLIDKYDGNVRMALRAYNAGSGNVASWQEKGLIDDRGYAIGGTGGDVSTTQAKLVVQSLNDKVNQDTSTIGYDVNNVRSGNQDTQFVVSELRKLPSFEKEDPSNIIALMNQVKKLSEVNGQPTIGNAEAAELLKKHIKGAGFISKRLTSIANSFEDYSPRLDSGSVIDMDSLEKEVAVISSGGRTQQAVSNESVQKIKAGLEAQIESVSNAEKIVAELTKLDGGTGRLKADIKKANEQYRLQQDKLTQMSDAAGNSSILQPIQSKTEVPTNSGSSNSSTPKNTKISNSDKASILLSNAGVQVKPSITEAVVDSALSLPSRTGNLLSTVGNSVTSSMSHSHNRAEAYAIANQLREGNSIDPDRIVNLAKSQLSDRELISYGINGGILNTIRELRKNK